VQGALEDAIAGRTGQRIRVTGAGRTDAGVHALGQVVSFRIATTIPIERMALALNSALPPDVRIRQVERAAEEFSARFSASSRVYGYLIQCGETPSPLLRRFSAFSRRPLDVQAMRAASRHLLGERDFAAFARELKPDESTFRYVMRLRVRRVPGFGIAAADSGLIAVTVEANAFVRGMVRGIVGTLIEVGAGKRAADRMPDLIASRDRRLAGFSAPPQGLCLLHVRYNARLCPARRDDALDARMGEPTSEDEL
jgi:tRNA pseudouridine38-40 synthase